MIMRKTVVHFPFNYNFTKFNHHETSSLNFLEMMDVLVGSPDMCPSLFGKIILLRLLLRQNQSKKQTLKKNKVDDTND